MQVYCQIERERACTERTPQNIEAVDESMRENASFSIPKHFTHQFTLNFAKRSRYDALQS
ncbi:hypothetical protein DOY81_010179 [Sarcophaga bullata]|nr:hypothetical protein DOY81_010179 [Sarcophaga bullata]